MGFLLNFITHALVFIYFSYVIMHTFICLSRQLLIVADFVMAQKEDLLGYNMKIYQYYNQKFGVPALVILIVLNFGNKVVVRVLD